MRPLGDRKITLHPGKSSPSKTRVPPSEKESPQMKIIAQFFCNGTIIGKIWIHGLGLGNSEGVVQDAKKVHRKTNCLARVGVGRSDGRHESNPSCQTITEVPSVCRIKAVFMMGTDKRVKETQNVNTILKDSQGHPGDQVG